MSSGIRDSFSNSSRVSYFLFCIFFQYSSRNLSKEFFIESTRNPCRDSPRYLEISLGISIGIHPETLTRIPSKILLGFLQVSLHAFLEEIAQIFLQSFLKDGLQGFFFRIFTKQIVETICKKLLNPEACLKNSMRIEPMEII